MNRAVTMCILAGACMVLQPLGAEAAAGQSGSGVTFGLQARNHTWKEFSGGGTQLLEESGSLYGLLFRVEQYFGGRLGLRADAQAFGGTVDYDGQTLEGVPASTDVDYIGGNVDVGPTCRLLGGDQSSLAGFAQIGMRIWNRGLNDSGDAIGYDELWAVTAGRIGAKARADLAADFGLFAEGGYRIPIYAEETLSEGDITVEPEEQGSFFAEAGVSWKMLFASLAYEKLEFDRSDSEILLGSDFVAEIYQPKSENELVTINAGVIFRF